MDDLESVISDAFKEVVRPSRERIISHQCSECWELRDDLAPHDSSSVPANILNNHCWDLPLLTKEAYRYYLPAYMRQAIRDPKSNAFDGLLTHLTMLSEGETEEQARERSKPFTSQQRDVIRRFLKWAAEADSAFEEDVDLGLRLWSTV